MCLNQIFQTATTKLIIPVTPNHYKLLLIMFFMLKRCDNFGHLSLEDIANDSRLIPEIFHQELNYQNPQKSKEVFYEFVREYANLHNYKINETELGLKHQLILGFGLQNLVYLFSPTFVFDLFYVFGG